MSTKSPPGLHFKKSSFSTAVFWKSPLLENRTPTCDVSLLDSMRTIQRRKTLRALLPSESVSTVGNHQTPRRATILPNRTQGQPVNVVRTDGRPSPNRSNFDRLLTQVKLQHAIIPWSQLSYQRCCQPLVGSNPIRRFCTLTFQRLGGPAMALSCCESPHRTTNN